MPASSRAALKLSTESVLKSNSSDNAFKESKSSVLLKKSVKVFKPSSPPLAKAYLISSTNCC